MLAAYSGLASRYSISRNDARRSGIKGDAAGGPYRARTAQRGQPVVNSDAKPDQRQAGIPAIGHPGGAGVVLLAAEADPVLPDADDGGDDADLETAAFECPALLDMRLEISDVPPACGRRARPAGKTRVALGSEQGASAAVARGVDVRVGDGADIGSAAEERTEMPFLVAPCRDFNGAIGVRVEVENSGGFQRINDTKRPIEPAGIILAFEMRAGQQFRPGFCACAEHIADAVDCGGEVRLGQMLRQPFHRAHVRLRVGRLVNAGLVGADAAECMETRTPPFPAGARPGIVRHEA